uniref:succinylglutamate desuccinylase/aspartoacylase domain-containing protein n=1 Tax=Haloferax profundi TaxID=1544718 RepID=UPI000ABCAF2C
MRIYELGDGTPEVSVVGSIHGDEPCGARAIERFVAEDPDVERPVKLIVANEEALDADVRYLDEDLNRAFPGDPHAENHERRLAYDLGR